MAATRNLTGIPLLSTQRHRRRTRPGAVTRSVYALIRDGVALACAIFVFNPEKNDA
jgi:hypothetical protein